MTDSRTGRLESALAGRDRIERGLRVGGWVGGSGFGKPYCKFTA